jgi:predicted Zn-dependent peptidase
VSIKTVDSVYALEGEDVTGDGVGVLLNCLLDPLLEGGGFKPSVTETEKQSCVDQIEAELNDKRVYAFRRASQIMFEGEPAAVHAHGTVEGVKAVTPESAYKAYQNLLRTARIEIVCVGCNDFISVRNTLSDAFSDIERGETENCRSDPSLLKKEILTREEKIDVSQSKMVLGFKSDCPDSDALTLMAKIYGGSPTSKLFENVREKMSLCYYCWAKFFFNKRIILCECGVEKDNIETAKKEILSQFDLMRSSDFTDEEIGHAALSLQNDLRIFNDSLSGVKAWYLDHIYRCDIITPEQAIERYKQVTRERIVKAAESVSLDTVYILTSE